MDMPKEFDIGDTAFVVERIDDFDDQYLAHIAILETEVKQIDTEKFKQNKKMENTTTFRLWIKQFEKVKSLIALLHRNKDFSIEISRTTESRAQCCELYKTAEEAFDAAINHQLPFCFARHEKSETGEIIYSLNDKIIARREVTERLKLGDIVWDNKRGRTRTKRKITACEKKSYKVYKKYEKICLNKKNTPLTDKELDFIVDNINKINYLNECVSFEDLLIYRLLATIKEIRHSGLRQ